MEKDIESFKQNLLDSKEVLSPSGTHHEFASGLHGIKLDFGNILYGSELFRQWVRVSATDIGNRYSEEELSNAVLLSVASGTNLVVQRAARLMKNGIQPLLTEKVSSGKVKLTNYAERYINKHNPQLAIVLEDVGTTGGTTSSAVLSAREAGVGRVEVLNTWQRREKLEKLIAIQAVYHSIIHEPLPDYFSEECQISGYCAKGWDLVKKS